MPPLLFARKSATWFFILLLTKVGPCSTKVYHEALAFICYTKVGPWSTKVYHLPWSTKVYHAALAFICYTKIRLCSTKVYHAALAFLSSTDVGYAASVFAIQHLRQAVYAFHSWLKTKRYKVLYLDCAAKAIWSARFLSESCKRWSVASRTCLNCSCLAFSSSEIAVERTPCLEIRRWLNFRW